MTSNACQEEFCIFSANIPDLELFADDVHFTIMPSDYQKLLSPSKGSHSSSSHSMWQHDLYDLPMHRKPVCVAWNPVWCKTKLSCVILCNTRASSKKPLTSGTPHYI